MLPQEILKKEHSETLASVSGNQISVFQAMLELNENGEMVGDGGGGMETTEFSVVYHCEFIF